MHDLKVIMSLSVIKKGMAWEYTFSASAPLHCWCVCIYRRNQDFMYYRRQQDVTGKYTLKEDLPVTSWLQCLEGYQSRSQLEQT